MAAEGPGDSSGEGVTTCVILVKETRSPRQDLRQCVVGHPLHKTGSLPTVSTSSPGDGC